MELSGTEAYVYAWADKKVLEQMQAMFPGMKVSESEKDGKYLYYISIPPRRQRGPGTRRRLSRVLRGPTTPIRLYRSAMFPYAAFTTYDEILAFRRKPEKHR